MEDQKITIKDVAKKTGMSLATVHRALNDKPGVSENNRKLIKAAAEEINYKPNHFAASLKRKAIRIAAVMVSPDYAGRFYFQDMWRGCDEFIYENLDYHIDFLRLPFSNDEGAVERLKYLWNTFGADIQGILITPTNSVGHRYNVPGMQYFLEKFTQAGVPIVFIGNDMEKVERLCCVCPHTEISNRLIAEYIYSILPPEGRILTCSRTKDVPAQICNLTLIEQYMNELSYTKELYKIFQQEGEGSGFVDVQKLIYQETTQLLTAHPDIKLLYSCNARGTIPMAQAVLDLNLAGKVALVGNDIYTESAAFLEQGVVTALLFKYPRQQGYQGLKTLFNNIVKNEYPSSSSIYVASVVVMKSNLQFFV